MGNIFTAMEKAGMDKTIMMQRYRPLTDRMAQKSDTFIVAADTIIKGPTMLMLLSDLDLPNQSTNTKFFKYYSLLSKMQLIGTNDIKQTLSAFLHELTSTYLMLLFERCRLLIRQGNIDLLSTFISKSKSREEFHLRTFFRLTNNQYADGKNRNALLNDLKHEIEQQKIYLDEQHRLIAVQNKELFHYTKLCMIKARELSQLIPSGFLS